LDLGAKLPLVALSVRTTLATGMPGCTKVKELARALHAQRWPWAPSIGKPSAPTRWLRLLWDPCPSDCM